VQRGPEAAAQGKHGDGMEVSHPPHHAMSTAASRRAGARGGAGVRARCVDCLTLPPD
jgi:hypothetical protein